jgi:hypothetical protein
MSTVGRKAKNTTPPVTANTSAFERAASTAGLTASKGKGAVKHQYQAGIASGASLKFTGSVDIDEECRVTEPESHRWDYGLGLQRNGESEFAVWVEPHPASSTGEIAKIIAKLDWLERKLERPEFKDLEALTRRAAQAGVFRFHWLAMTGDIRIRPGSREAAVLSKRGLRLPTRYLALS